MIVIFGFDHDGGIGGKCIKQQGVSSFGPSRIRDLDGSSVNSVRGQSAICRGDTWCSAARNSKAAAHIGSIEHKQDTGVGNGFASGGSRTEGDATGRRPESVPVRRLR